MYPSDNGIAATLRAFGSPDCSIEIRAPKTLLSDTGQASKNYVLRFGPDEFDVAEQQVNELLGRSPAIYFLLNGVDPGLELGNVREGANSGDIPGRRFILIDCDPKRPTGTSSTDEEKEASRQLAISIRDTLHSRGWSEPIIADSGNGYHLVYPVRLPSDESTSALFRSVLIAIATKFDNEAVRVDRVVFDAPRLVKLYGTMTRKGESSPERPYRMSKLLDVPEVLTPVDRADLEAVAKEWGPSPAAPVHRNGTPTLNGHAHRDRTPDREWTLEERAAAYLEECPGAVSGENGHSTTFTAACAVGPGFDLSEDQAFRLLWDVHNPKCQPAWSEKELRHKVKQAFKKEPRRGFLRDAPREEWEGNRQAVQPVVAQEDVPVEPGNHGQPFRLTDLGNAERMIALVGSKIRYIHPWKKWLTFNGKRWEIDNRARINRYAKRTVRNIYREAARTEDPDRKAALLKWAHRSETRPRLEAMIALAACELGVPAMPEDLDRDPWLLNCLNGTLDLQTGTLRPHNPDDMLTKVVPVAFDPDAKCELWESTLKLFLVDDAMIAFWQRLFGYACTGVVRDQILPIAWGEGANGKSTILGAMLAVLGPDYAMKCSPEFLMERRGESHPTERASLFGKRLVIAMETGEGASINETLIKELTGNERMSARRMREDVWEFDPTHKVFMGTNHKPQIKGTDYAIWRRVKLVPFTTTLTPEQAQLDVPERLRAEYAGILAWAVRGCLDWQANGLGEPQAVIDATAEYREDQNTFGKFISEECLIHPDMRSQSSLLFARYTAWAKNANYHPMNIRRFGEKLMSEVRSLKKVKSSDIWYQGIGLRSESDGSPPY
jgi:putative DNA primase/helicase